MYIRTWAWGLIISATVGGWLSHPATSTAQETSRSPLDRGSWALQFRISDNFTLSNFTGSIISLKRHHSARSAFRAGFSLSLSSGSSETDPSDTSLPVEIDNDDVGLLVDLQYVRYSNPAGRLSPYWAIGPRVGYAKQNLKSATGDDQVERYERRQWTVGVIGSLGAEWFPVRFIGLHAEYGLTLTYSSIKAEREDTPFTETQTGRVWTFEGDGVLLGLSVYF
jgi:hypothetical protein